MKFKELSICILILSFYHTSFSQCSLIVPAHTYNICEGNTVQLNSYLDCTAILDTNTFNSGVLGNGWTSPSNPMFTNPCGPSMEGPYYLWIGPASIFPREIISDSVYVADSCTICFDMKYASQANGTPCEGPDESTEGVHLQYSTSGASGPWTELNYWDPGGGYDPNLTQWNTYCQNVSNSGYLWFRWYQTNTSGNDYDHWGIDNVVITGSIENNTDIVTWYNSSGIFYSGTIPPPFIPDSSMWVFVTHNNGVNINIDSIRVNVFQVEAITLNSFVDTICYTDPPFPLSGNPTGGYFTGTGVIDSLFNPSLADIGWNNITYHYGITTSDSIFGEIPVFTDDFSSDKGWTGYDTSGVWERGPATSSIGCTGNQDPSIDHTITSDNFIIGNYIGGCYPNSLTSTLWLTTPTINCSNFNNCKIQFYSFSGCESPTWDHMYIDVSSNGGTSWTNIYSNSTTVSESAWTLRNYTVTQANNCTNFKLRFGMGITDASVTYSGWNIDDFSLICDGSAIHTDTTCYTSVSDSVYVKNCTDIEFANINNDFIKIMPNPALGDFITIEWQIENLDNSTTLEIYNFLGQKVYVNKIIDKAGQKEIQLESLNNGIYEIRLINSLTTFSRNKIIVLKN